MDLFGFFWVCLLRIGWDSSRFLGFWCSPGGGIREKKPLPLEDLELWFSDRFFLLPRDVFGFGFQWKTRTLHWTPLWGVLGSQNLAVRPKISRLGASGWGKTAAFQTQATDSLGAGRWRRVRGFRPTFRGGGRGHEVIFMGPLLGPPLPFYQLFGGRVRLLKQTTEKKLGYPCSNLSAGGPRLGKPTKGDEVCQPHFLQHGT